MVWDGLAAVDLFCAGLGAWTFIFAFLSKAEGDSSRKARLVSYIVAFVAVALGAIILALDAKAGMHDPLRFLGLISNLGSVMAWGVILISLFLICSLICIIILAAKKDVPVALDAVVAIIGVGVSLYTGILLGTSSAFPLWNLPMLPVAFLASAALSGYAAFRIVKDIVSPSSEMSVAIKQLAIVLPLIQAVAIAVLLVVVSLTSGSSAEAASASLQMLMTGAQAFAFWGGAILVGTVAPLVFAFLANRQNGSSASGLGIAAWICALIGGFAFRYAIVMAAVPIFG